MKKIAIIGGGPAGMMAAASFLESVQVMDYEVHIFETNKVLGRKLVISGGGRCNVTTGIFDKKTLATKYTRGFDFLETALGEFSPKKCKKWFESHDLPLKVQPDNRVFPVSDDGNDVLAVFEKIFKNNSKVFLHFREKIQNIEKHSEKFIVTSTNLTLEADYCVIATGGNAYRHTGSTGDGYAFAKKFGHQITTLGPSLSSFLIREEFLKKISGTTFSDAKIIFSHQNELKNLTGSLLLTHFGISGPLTFMLSSHLAWSEIAEQKIFVAPIASMSFDDWNAFLKQKFQEHPKKKIFSILHEKLSEKFCDALIHEFFTDLKDIFVGGISKNDREKIAKILGDGISITLLERRP